MARPALSPEIVEQQRERALAAALVAFARQGPEAVSFRGMAGAVGLSPMALYRYFPGGRSEVLTTIRGRGFEELAAMFERILADPAQQGDQILQIVRMTLAVIEFALGRPNLYQLMFSVTQPEERESYLGSRRARAWKIAVEPFSLAFRAGLLRADETIFPHLFFASVHGATAFELSGQPDPNRRLDRLIGPLLETLLAGAAAAPATIHKVRRVVADWQPPRPSRRRRTSKKEQP